MKTITWIALSIVLFVALVLGTAQATGAQRGLPTPPGAALQWFHHHTPTSTATHRPTIVPSRTPTAIIRATATKSPTPQLAQCWLEKLGIQYGTPMAQWGCFGANGTYHAWIPATVTPDWP